MRHQIRRRVPADSGTLSLFDSDDGAITLIDAPSAPTHPRQAAANEEEVLPILDLDDELPPLPDFEVCSPQTRIAAEGASPAPVEIPEVSPPAESTIRTVAAPSGPRNTRNYTLSNAKMPSGRGAIDQRVANNLTALRVQAQCLQEKREATDDEKAALAAYSGWGGLVTAFISGSSTHTTVQAALTDDQYESARKGVLTQHFSPDWAVDMVYDALQRLGVKPKRILDPACGTGMFLSRIPAAWKDDAMLYGVEIDPILGSMASLLHPDATIDTTAFEKAKLPNDVFDLVVTNVPFDTFHPFDEETPQLSLSLHNFFIAKALRKCRPGGTVAVITSAYTLDSKEEKVRRLFAKEADLIASVRLPNWAFRQTANTEVSADVLIFRKRERDDMVPLAPDWIDSVSHEGALINKAMLDNEDGSFMGRRITAKTQHGLRHIAHAAESEIDTHVSRWLVALPAGACATPEVSTHQEEQIDQDMKLAHLRHLRFGAYALDEGQVVQIDVRGTPELRKDLAAGQIERIQDYISVRDSLKRLLLAQISHEDDAPSKSARYDLTCRYDAFVSKHKAINSRYNRSILKRDPDYALVSSIEIFDHESQTATKGVIFEKRTVRPRAEVTHAANASEALLVSLNQVGRVDLALIARLARIDQGQAAEELSVAGKIYLDPVSQEWQSAAVYLCGDIRSKLADAEFAAKENPQYERNIASLHAALPERIPFQEINIQLGATFVKTDYIEAFIDHLMANESAKKAAMVTHMSADGKWRVTPSGVDFGNDSGKWGTSRIKGRKLVQYALNMATPTIRDTIEVEDGVRTVVNPDDTLAAREKLMEIQEEFKTWIWRDESRARDIEDIYNRTFNSSVPFEADGSHLTLPGMNETITLRPKQKDAIWRGIAGGNLLVGHCVGAGKTLVGICIAMELRRLGLRQRSIITTPKNVVGQFAREFLSAYPLANLLVIDTEDVASENREYLLGRLATGNFDAVIMSHSTYASFGVSKADMEAATADWMNAIDEAQASTSDRALLKSLERRKETLEAMTDRLLDRAKKSILTFDQLGCDQLIVDESQAFKNLWFTTSMASVAGLSAAASARAFDMFIKVRAVSKRHHERGGCVFMSATPIANTLAEMYHLMRYMMMPTLIEKGIDSFDSWAANFGRTVVNIETTPEGGGFRLQTRFARFENVPELMALFGSFADIQTKEDLNLPVPAIDGGKPHVISAPASPALKAYIRTLVQRAEAVRSSDPEERPHPKVDNMLKITTDGRKAALDMRLVGGRDEPGSKLNLAVDNVYRIWKETEAKRLTQIVFCDLGTPGNERLDVYQDVRDKLMARGIPRDEIAFVHDYNTRAKLELLQARMNRGSIRVLVASTEKAGIGFNVQRLLVAIHELDCPWRPDQVEQRGGRIERQGNLNDTIYMCRYVTEESFDAYNWNLIEQKLRFILQVMSGKCKVRSVEDIEVRALTVAEVKAIATGNPRIVERALLQQQEAKLESLSRAHYKEASYGKGRAHALAVEIKDLTQTLDKVQEDVLTAAASSAKAPIEVQGKTFLPDNKSAIADALQMAFADAATYLVDKKITRIGTVQVGHYRGFKLGISSVWNLSSSTFEWIIEGSLRWGTQLGQDWVGNFTRISNLVNRLPEELTKKTELLAQKTQELNDLGNAKTAAFPRAAELSEIRLKLRAVEEELGITAMDTQASGVDDESEPQGKDLEEAT